MRLLFYKPHFSWPFSSGHDVHTFNMMRAMSRLGASIGLVTKHPSPPEALCGLDLGVHDVLQQPQPGMAEEPFTLSTFQERFRSYWGVDRAHVARVGRVAREFQADAVVVSGLDVLPLLGAVQNATRVWYAADEWFVHHMSQVGLSDRSTWGNAKDALIKGAYERAYRGKIDRAWVVSDLDRTAMRWVAGVRNVDVLPNGVDAERYQPMVASPRPESAVFWGRLDFGPNIQALQWFCQNVWPAARQRHPSAEFTIIGFSPGPEVRALAKMPGVSLQPDLPDVREPVSRHQIVVLPFVSGGGIKNKLLEAAAMGMPIVGTRKSAQGLNGTPPFEVAGSPAEWVAAMSALWSDAAGARALGQRARAWVVAEHSWEQVARTALDRLGRPA
jgi:glycosyltransferase involved in cell wall biosynthesis